jgi:hypothetical protein
MKIAHIKCLDAPEGVYYNEETDFVFTLENKNFKIGKHEGMPVTAYVYDIHSSEGVNIQAMLPKFNPIRIGDL